MIYHIDFTFYCLGAGYTVYVYLLTHPWWKISNQQDR